MLCDTYSFSPTPSPDRYILPLAVFAHIFSALFFYSKSAPASRCDRAGARVSRVRVRARARARARARVR